MNQVLLLLYFVAITVMLLLPVRTPSLPERLNSATPPDRLAGRDRTIYTHFGIPFRILSILLVIVLTERRASDIPFIQFNSIHFISFIHMFHDVVFYFNFISVYLYYVGYEFCYTIEFNIYFRI